MKIDHFQPYMRLAKTKEVVFNNSGIARPWQAKSVNVNITDKKAAGKVSSFYVRAAHPQMRHKLALELG